MGKEDWRGPCGVPLLGCGGWRVGEGEGPYRACPRVLTQGLVREAALG